MGSKDLNYIWELIRLYFNSRGYRIYWHKQWVNFIYLCFLYYVRGKKVKLSLCLNNYALRHEGEWGSGCIDSHFLNLNTNYGVSGQLHAPNVLPRGKEPPVPIGKGAGWAPEPIWTMWRRENYGPYRGSNSGPSAVQPVASRYTDCPIPVGNSTNTYMKAKLPLCSDGGEWPASRPSRLTTEEGAPSTHYARRWWDPRAGLDAAETRETLDSSVVQPTAQSL
jgi:hypothetical protein